MSMILRDLKGILYSNTGNIQFATVYDIDSDADLESGCSVEYAINHYGNMEVKRIQAYGNELIINLKKE